MVIGTGVSRVKKEMKEQDMNSGDVLGILGIDNINPDEDGTVYSTALCGRGTSRLVATLAREILRERR